MEGGVRLPNSSNDYKKGFIILKNISKSYSKDKLHVKALDGVDLKINQGDFIAIMGESGAGKSTLLNIIGLIDDQTSGKYNLLGKDINNYNKNAKAQLRNELIGFVMQDFALVDRYSVYENVEIPLLYSDKYKKINKKDKKEKIYSVLKQLGIEDKILSKSINLSGGQRQRVAIARALINDPSIIIADEPTGALDTKTAHEIMKILKRINEENNITVIIVTHDSSVAEYCNQIYNISEGRIKK